MGIGLCGGVYNTSNVRNDPIIEPETSHVSETVRHIIFNYLNVLLITYNIIYYTLNNGLIPNISSLSLVEWGSI